ncbi:MAG TPA: HAD hydrolase family protein [Candidatus Dormibacteraeota bacterium]|nr:HAD hydrolase family protein [Candidatus Dormibacteraeota bacterium]
MRPARARRPSRGAWRAPRVPPDRPRDPPLRRRAIGGSIRLVAADLDGTLVGGAIWARRSARRPSPRVLAAVEACRARGVVVVAVTARRWVTAAAVLRELRGAPLAVVCGGTEVRDVATGRELVSSRLPPGVVAAACERIASCGLQPMVDEDGGSRAGHPRADGIAASTYLRRVRARRVHAAELAGPGASRVLAMGGRSRCELAARRCAGLPARTLLQRCIVDADSTGETPTELHVMAADKGDAVRTLCRLLGVPRARTLAIGDAESDLPMLRAAGVAVLMGQATASMVRPGFVVAPPVTADGAAWALETLVLDGSRPA